MVSSTQFVGTDTTGFVVVSLQKKWHYDFMARVTYRFENGPSGFSMKGLRRTLGMSQEQFAELLGRDSRTIQRYDKGTRGAFYQVLSSLSDVYKISIDIHVSGLWPKVIAVMNPSASTGSSTLCLSLAGYLAKRKHRVRLLTTESIVCSLLSGRASSLPRIDFSKVSDSGTLSDEINASSAYDVLLIDCPRICHGDVGWERSYRPFLRTVSSTADLIIVPLRYSYPYLECTPQPCFYRDMVEILSCRTQAKVLFVMNQVAVPDEGEMLPRKDCAEYNDGFEQDVRSFLVALDTRQTFLAKTRIGDRKAYQEIGGARFLPASFAIEYDGKLLHDMAPTLTCREAKAEIERIWDEVNVLISDRQE